jgi:polygalacturonase
MSFPFLARRCLTAGLICLLPLAALAADVPSSYNVRAFGATGDGTTLDTDAINRTIDAAAAAGGGTVEFPAGSYLSFSIRLKSHITLHLSAGCRIIAAKAAENFGDYDVAEPNESGDKYQYQDFGHSHFHNSLIWGEKLEDIAITGPGLIFGQGLSRSNGFRPGRPGASAAGPNNTPTPGDTAGQAPGAHARVDVPLPKADRGGNKSIALRDCRNVTLSGFSILQGGWFALLASGIDNFSIENVKVDTNRDGFDIDSCRNVRISDCTVNAINDDAIVLKSTYVSGALKPTENVTITGCEVSGYDTGSFFDGTYRHAQAVAVDRDGPTGRIKIGTESNGDFKNITIANCVFDRSRGLALETVDGSLIEGVSVTNLTMRNVSNAAIFLRIGARLRGPEGTKIGAIRHVSISHVTAVDVDPRYPILIAGLPGHPIEDLALSDIHVVSRGGLSLAEVAAQPPSLVNTFFLRGPGLAGPRDPYMPPEQAKAYPEPSMLGLLPAYGIYVRHARDLSFRDVELAVVKPDTRSAVVLDDVSGADFEHLRVQRTAGVPAFVLRQVTDFAVRNSPGIADTRRPAADQESF